MANIHFSKLSKNRTDFKAKYYVNICITLDFTANIHLNSAKTDHFKAKYYVNIYIAQHVYDFRN